MNILIYYINIFLISNSFCGDYTDNMHILNLISIWSSYSSVEDLRNNVGNGSNYYVFYPFFQHAFERYTSSVSSQFNYSSQTRLKD